MPRIFITGSTDGLGLAAARTLIGQGHEVVLHARSNARASAISAMTKGVAGIVIGDLSSADEVRSIAEQVNANSQIDAVIHNAGIYLESVRGNTAEGHAKTIAVNTLAPYMLTALIKRPGRLVYLSSGMHMGASDALDDTDWSERRWDPGLAYSESKLHVATLAAAIARHWPEVLSNAVDPGWVPTKMGGAGAPDDLEQGHLTQTWLSVSGDPAAKVSGRYWHHREVCKPAAHVTNEVFQDRLIEKLAALTGLRLF